MWYGCVSSHGVSWSQAGPSTALGTWLAAWPSSPGMGRRTLFRQRPLGSFGRTGPRGRSSIGFHGASAPGAAPIVINRCMFCWEAGHWPSRGDNGLPPSPTPTPFFFRGRFLPASAQIPLSGASPQPLTLQNKRERECLDRQSECEKGALYDQDGGLASQAERLGCRGGREGRGEGPTPLGSPTLAACPSWDRDVARAQP